MMQNQELKRDLGRYLERIGTGPASDAYRRGWDACFGKKDEAAETGEEGQDAEDTSRSPTDAGGA
jgi:hypothetical protein